MNRTKKTAFIIHGLKMKFIVLSFALLIVGCDNQYTRDHLVELMKKDFAMNEDIYNFIKDYFIQSEDSVRTLEYDLRLGLIRIIKIPTNKDLRLNKPFIIRSLDEIDRLPFVRNKDTVKKILVYLKTKEIVNVIGTRELIIINHREFSLVPCFSLRYEEGFDPNDEDTKHRVNNFSNVNTTNWIFLLADGWYIQGEKCF